MPTKVELMKQLKESQEDEKKNFKACTTIIQQLTNIETQYNKLVSLVKGCDCDEKLDLLKDTVKHIPLSIEIMKHLLNEREEE